MTSLLSQIPAPFWLKKALKTSRFYACSVLEPISTLFETPSKIFLFWSVIKKLSKKVTHF